MYLTTAAFWCRGEAPQRAESDFTCVGTSRLAPPPVRQMDPEFLSAGRFHDPEKWGESVGTGPDAGIEGLEKPARARNYGVSGLWQGWNGIAQI